MPATSSRCGTAGLKAIPRLGVQGVGSPGRDFSFVCRVSPKLEVETGLEKVLWILVCGVRLRMRGSP